MTEFLSHSYVTLQNVKNLLFGESHGASVSFEHLDKQHFNLNLTLIPTFPLGITALGHAMVPAVKNGNFPMTGFHPVWYSSVPDYPKKNMLSVVPYNRIQLVHNSSKKNFFLQTLVCKKCLFPPLKMMAFCYAPPPVEPW